MSIRLLLLALGRKIREWLELDYMEGCDTDAHAQTNYVTNDTTTIGSWYPTQDADHVKATTTKQPGTFNTFFATDPTKSLTGSWAGTSWLADNDLGGSTNQRFHIDLGSAKIVTKIYYENSHTSGSETDTGVKNFTFWGSNTAGSIGSSTYRINKLFSSSFKLSRCSTINTALFGCLRFITRLRVWFYVYK